MLTKNDIKFIASLKHGKYRKANSLFVAEGNKVVAELLDTDFKCENILITNTWAEKYKNIQSFLPFYEVITQKEMNQVSSMSTPPGILAVSRIPDIKFTAKDAEDEIIILLDGINDPGNLGTIIRTAEWFGIRKLVCSEDSAEIWQPKTIQSAMGSVFRIEVMASNLQDFLKNNKMPVYGASMSGENIFNKKIENKGIIIIGSESHGISKELMSMVSVSVHIPRQKGSRTESLNASVAAGIIMAEIMKK